MEKQASKTRKNLHPMQFKRLMTGRPGAFDALQTSDVRKRYLVARQSGERVPKFDLPRIAEAYSFSNRLVTEISQDDQAARASKDPAARAAYTKKWGNLDLRRYK